MNARLPAKSRTTYCHTWPASAADVTALCGLPSAPLTASGLMPMRNASKRSCGTACTPAGIADTGHTGSASSRCCGPQAAGLSCATGAADAPSGLAAGCAAPTTGQHASANANANVIAFTHAAAGSARALGRGTR